MLGRDQRAVVVADVLGEEDLVEGDVLLVAGDDGIGQFEPGSHAVVDQLGLS